MYRIENTIVERLKEQDLNAIDLLQTYTKINDKTERRITIAGAINDNPYELMIFENTDEAVVIQMKELGFDEKFIRNIQENAIKHNEPIRILRFLEKKE